MIPSTQNPVPATKMTHYRWVICAMLFFATTVNYLDRQVLSLLQPSLEKEFHWTDSDYGTITAVFSLFYALAVLFVGRFIDRLGIKKGYAIAISVWSLGAMLHAGCAVATRALVGSEHEHGLLSSVLAGTDIVAQISAVSVLAFSLCRCVLALGEAGNFPAAIKATAEYFPKRDRAFATGIFNSGANIGAIVAPLSVPFIAQWWGWEMAFLAVGAIGFVWMGLWIFIYKKPEENPAVNTAELAYIRQDEAADAALLPEAGGAEVASPAKKDASVPSSASVEGTPAISFLQCWKYRQTWAFALGKFLTDGVWWFFLFWTPAYLKAQYNMSGTEIALPIAVLYSITVIGSVFGGKLPTFFINRGMDPYSGRMCAMLLIAVFPVVILFAQPLGTFGYWLPVLLIAVGCSAHQAWSANIYSTVSDMFPKSAVGSIVGIGTMAGGISSFLINKTGGMLFDYSEATQLAFCGFVGKEAGYFIIFAICAFAYLVGWTAMKLLVPRYRPIGE